ncbi:MAG: L,D-transpeptidase [Thermoleophilaceae bacterium]|nr:L,D-transpeptidase [Thermoleophilaceae bacterium]
MKRVAALLPVLLIAAVPAHAKVGLNVQSGITDRDDVYVAKGQSVNIRGSATGSAPAVTVSIRSGKRTVLVKPDVKSGAFRVAFKARKSGSYLLRATDGSSSAAVRVNSVLPRAGSGSSGWKVRVLQKGLRDLGFATSTGGRFNGATGRAVNAFRKTNTMKRSTFASRAVFAKVLRGQGGFELRYKKKGSYVEFDWSRQVLALAKDGKVVNAYHASSGTSATPTVFGTFRFYRKQPGRNSLGMVHSNYFIRGYAIHGYKSVPNFPASHGCIRVPVPSSKSIDNQLSLGQTIYVYR